MIATSNHLASGFLALAFVSGGGVLAYESVLVPGPTSPFRERSRAATPTCSLQDDHGASASPEACLLCHEPLRKVVEAPVPHLPVSDGECTLCHSPHAARYPKLLNRRGRALCFTCHEEEVLGYQTGSVHTPVQQGLCQDCHEVHGSENEGLLVAVGNDLCLGCHEEMHAALESTSVHAPFVDGDCSDCHLSHNSAYPDQLVAPVEQVCAACHDDTDADLVDAHFGIPIEGSRCATCHDAHASSQPGLLRAHAHEPFADQSCEMCHLVDSDTPQVVMATDSRLCSMCHDGYPRPGDGYVHQPVAEGDCSTCHVPHASAVAGLLPTEAGDLCMQCHSELEVRHENSRSAHPVNDEVSCQACHQVHSSSEEFLLNAGAIRTCLSCHGDQRHGHPLGSDRLDPRTGESITCVTCHDPHGTEFPLQLRGDQSRGLCLECHSGDGDDHQRGR